MWTTDIISGFCPKSSQCVYIYFNFQINSPRRLPLKGCGKVVQAACGGTQVAVLNGQFIQLHSLATLAGEQTSHTNIVAGHKLKWSSVSSCQSDSTSCRLVASHMPG